MGRGLFPGPGYGYHRAMMHRLAPAVFAITLAALPVAAQDKPPEPGTPEEGMSLIERGARILLDGLFREMEPALRDVGPKLRDLQAELGPALEQLLAMIDDVRNYDAPIRLPNGDILIPRRPGAPPPPEMRTPGENLPPSPDGEKPGIDL